VHQIPAATQVVAAEGKRYFKGGRPQAVFEMTIALFTRL
jgi:hypothetical protein